ncbi:MAG: glycosyltransferase [Candidatus Pacebacteria bacterium]|nr:glycosyltransferase [Candidatus Paceibacterota bacterium]
MKISIFVHCYPPAKGGLEYLIGQIKQILGKEHEVHVFTGKGRTLDSYKTFNDFVSDKEDKKNKVHRLNFNKFWQRMANKFFGKLVLKFSLIAPFYFGPILNFSKQDKKIIENSDLIIGAGMPTMTFFYSYLFSRKFNKPLILHPSYHDVSYYNHCLFFKLALNRADKVIYQTDQEKKGLIKNYNVDPRKMVQLTYSPYTKAEIKKRKIVNQKLLNKRKTRIEKNKEITLGFVGQISVRKNLKLLANFLKEYSDEFNKKGYQLKLILAGVKTNSSPVVEGYFSGLEKQVEIIYNFKDKEEIFNKIDIFVNPSYEESLGIVNLEAIFYGVPLLVHERAAFIEILGEEGFIINRSTLAKKIDTLFNNIYNFEKQFNILNIYSKGNYSKMLDNLLKSTL